MGTCRWRTGKLMAASGGRRETVCQRLPPRVRSDPYPQQGGEGRLARRPKSGPLAVDSGRAGIQTIKRVLIGRKPAWMLGFGSSLIRPFADCFHTGGNFLRVRNRAVSGREVGNFVHPPCLLSAPPRIPGRGAHGPHQPRSRLRHTCPRAPTKSPAGRTMQGLMCTPRRRVLPRALGVMFLLGHSPSNAPHNEIRVARP